MTFAVPVNTTCDIYHAGHSPPATPDVAGVSCGLRPWPRNIHAPTGVATEVYTHWLDVPLVTDIRGQQGGGDLVYIPDRNGTEFVCVGVERIRVGGGGDFKRAYLNRGAVTWPSNDL